MSTVRIHYYPSGAPAVPWTVAEYRNGELVAEYHVATSQVTFAGPVVMRLLVERKAEVELDARLVRVADGSLRIEPV